MGSGHSAKRGRRRRKKAQRKGKMWMRCDR
jgi:hypothetical protein